jgi:hypothetical protein
MKSLTVRLEPTTRTDLLCVSCGRFLKREARRRDTGFVILTRAELDPGFGVHRACVADLKAARASRKPALAEPTPEETSVT